MKKILVVLMICVAMTSVVYATEFTDIAGASCEDAVNYLSYLGIVNGVDVGEFAPQKNVTRAELSKMVVGILSVKEKGTKTFSDIQNHWGKSFIESAASAGLLNGYADGTFQPDKAVTYAEAIAILLRGMGYSSLENTSDGAWYRYYMEKMQDMELQDGISELTPEANANRGNVATLLWNAMKTKENGTSILEKYFADNIFIDHEKITNITAEDGKIVYQTEKHRFYVEDNIDFSDLGGKATGILNQKTGTIHSLKVDSGLNVRKISGNTKTIHEMGYDLFNQQEVWGYGQKEYAQYIEIIVEEKTNEVKRVVFYDTRESHFAEKVKVGTTKVSIESKDVYDESVIEYKNTRRVLKILRTESVKEIDKNAVLVHDGKVVDWSTVPNNSVIREIKKNAIYTYVHRYQDVALKETNINSSAITIGKKSYSFSEDCLCENTSTNIVMKLKEGLTVNDLRLIAQKDASNRIYWNEFDEIVKLEFTYNIWEEKAKEATENKKDNRVELTTELNRIGVVANAHSSFSNDGKWMVELKVISLPGKKSFEFQSDSTTTDIGDFVYQLSGDAKLYMVNADKKLPNVNIIYHYSASVDGNQLGEYQLREDTQFVEVVLQKSTDKNKKYAHCSVKNLTLEAFSATNKTYTLNMIVNKNNEVLRVYAIREIGSDLTVGIVKNIETTYSGDTITSRKIYVSTETGGTRRYNILVTDNIAVGDLIRYELVEKKTTQDTTKKVETVKVKGDDTLNVVEVYKAKLIGNSHDLIIDAYLGKKITLLNEEEDILVQNGKMIWKDMEYDLEEYLLMNATVGKNEENKWEFKSFANTTLKSLKMQKNARLVIDELTKTIVVYTGYTD